MKRRPPSRRGGPPPASTPPRGKAADSYDAFAVAAPGLEAILGAELEALGVKDAQVIDGGVEFRATRLKLYESNLQLRTASRVLVRLARFRAMSFAELEKQARLVPWERVLTRGQPVLLRVTCRKSRLYHSDAVAERIARDIAGRMDARATTTQAGEEGETDTSSNAQLIVVRFDHDRCTVSADSSGAHLHQRGYRTSVTQAPMRETLAAALVISSGWDRISPFLDPFCGSGTTSIEAALMAGRIAPGRNRDFRFMQWPGFVKAEWERVRKSAIRYETREQVPSIRGSDRSAAAVRAATENARRAGVTGLVEFGKGDAEHVVAGQGRGWVVSNPPYGVRLGDARETTRLMARFGQALRQRFGGWHVALLAPGDPSRAAGFPLEATVRTTNGGLRVQVYTATVPITRDQSND